MVVAGRVLDRRPLGSTGLEVSALGMGCGRLGSVPRPADLRAAVHAVSLALASGITFFDTADAYGRGLSERILGRAIAGRSENVIIATKCGLLKTPAAFLRATGSRLAGERGRSARRLPDAARELFRSRRSYDPHYVRRSVEASLRRLRREQIDLFLLHSPPTGVLTRAGFLEVLDALQTSGKIRSWGVSVGDADDAMLATELPGIAAIELPLNLCQTDALARAIPEAAARGIAVIARQPFASGGVARALREQVGAADRPSEIPERQAIFDACLQFALGVSGVSTVIAGMTDPEHVAANVNSAISARIDPDAMSRIAALVCGRP